MSRALRVLLVEDSDDDARLVTAELARGGLATDGVRRVESAAELTAALEEPWDVILADYQLHRFTARDALRILKDSRKDIPFIVVSGSIGEEFAVEMMRAGAQDYFRKENMTRLVAAIERELGDKRQREERRALVEQLRESEERLDRETLARADAEQRNRLQDQFLATLSHELRTPLTAILGWVTALKTRSPDAKLYAKGIASIERSARAQSQIIDDLLDLSRSITGQIRLEIRQINLARTVLDAIDVVQPAATAKGVALRGDIEDLGALAADASRVHQAVWNLLSNAVKYTPRGGHIDVTLVREGDRAVIRVRDDGEGIAADFLPHLFDCFSQADGSPTRRHGGLGVGLAIVRRLAELHGGSVSAASEGRGRGAVFTMELPISPVDAPDERPA